MAKKKSAPKAKKKTSTKKKTAKKAAKKTSAQKKTAQKKTAKKKTAQKKAAKKTAAKKTSAKKTTAAKKAAAKKTTKKAAKSDASSAAKRQAVLEVVLSSTSERIAKTAAASVWAISSEKTQDVRTAIAERRDRIELARTRGLADPEAPPAEIERRSSRDGYGFLRDELLRDEAAPGDVYAPWRLTAQRMRHELLPGLEAEVLDEIERELHLVLPPSLYDFAREWAGGELYTRPGGGFRVIPPTSYLSEVRGPLCNRMRQPYLPVVDLTCGDYLCLDMSQTSRGGKENPVYWWYGGEVQGRRVADGFGAFLRKLVDQGGRPWWWAS
ncbi:MAG TPA: hypothetical protein DEA08_05105 [Planctomycetes bacterium]|nr:hypothetical protein [Planctomycetota bacterium]